MSAPFCIKHENSQNFDSKITGDCLLPPFSPCPFQVSELELMSHQLAFHVPVT